VNAFSAVCDRLAPLSGQQRVAVCCSVLQCAAVCRSVVQCVAACCTLSIPPPAVCCSVLQCVAVCCSVVQYVAACCSLSIPPTAVRCGVLQCVEASTQEASWMQVSNPVYPLLFVLYNYLRIKVLSDFHPFK